VNGYVLVDKPAGPSSHTAVQQVRRALGFRGRRGTKAGHAGTLDPFASGLLLVLIGRATRLMPFVVGHDKRYLVDVRFGASSTTDDREGELTPSTAPAPDEPTLREAIQLLAASSEQVPPAVSALHVDGQRAYQRVRRGEVVAVPSRPVRFDSVELLEFDGTRAVLDVRCGTGTYMRALARDLGAAVGCPAYCEELRRLEVGEWHLDTIAPGPDAVTAADVGDCLDLLGDIARIQLDDAQLLDVAAGRRLPRSLAPDAAGPFALLAPDGALAALAEPTSDGTLLQPRTVLVDPPGALPAPGVQGSTS
jgi:tRNA pseudouridine55 synthase